MISTSTTEDVRGGAKIQPEPKRLIADPVSEFVERMDYLERRYKGCGWCQFLQFPRDLMNALKDELTKPTLPFGE